MRKKTISTAQLEGLAAAPNSPDLEPFTDEMRRVCMHRTTTEWSYMSDWPDARQIREFEDELMKLQKGD